MKEITIKEMKEIAISRGGACLSKEYVDSEVKIRWQCKEKHTWEATPSNVKAGSWCPYCAGMHQTIENMQKLAESRGGKCLSKKYVNNITKLKWQCRAGHIWESTPHNIKRGSWCPDCRGLNLDRDSLYNLYTKQKKTATRIGEMLNCATATVLKYLRKYDIPIHHPKKLNRSLLCNLYIQRRKSLKEISTLLDCSPATIRKCLPQYNIPTRPKWHHAPSEAIKIAGVGEQVLLGSLLGDGSLGPSGASQKEVSPYYDERHGIKQKEYLLWKQKLLPLETTYREGVEHHPQPQFLKKYYGYCRIQSKTHPELKKYFNLKYKDKEGLQKMLDKLNAFGLFIWYLDDGCYKQLSDCVDIARKLTFSEYQIVKNWFGQKYEIVAKRGERTIRFSVDDSRKMLALFRPYISDIPRSMYYKVGLDEKKREEARKRRKEKEKEYRQRPEVKKKIKEYGKQYEQRSEVKKRRKEYYQKPEVKRKIKNKQRTLKYKRHKKRYLQRPEVKKRYKKYMREYRKEYNQRPEVKVRKREQARKR